MATTGFARSADPRREFTRVVNAFWRNRSVTVEEGKGFSSGALKVDGRIFAMLDSKDQFAVKLPKNRVNELAGDLFEPRPGRPMKEWLVVAAAGADWGQARQRSLRVRQ